MKKAIKLTLAVVLVMGATSLFAQKFGRINTQEIIMAMPETKTMQENMDTFAKELSDNIETMNVEFNTKLQDFQKNYNTFSDAIKEVKEKELNDMQTRTREFQERAQQDYQKKQNELLAPIIDKAKSAIDKVAAAGGFLVVFDTSTGSLAYFDEATLTDVAPAVKKGRKSTIPPWISKLSTVLMPNARISFACSSTLRVGVAKTATSTLSNLVMLSVTVYAFNSSGISFGLRRIIPATSKSGAASRASNTYFPMLP